MKAPFRAVAFVLCLDAGCLPALAAPGVMAPEVAPSVIQSLLQRPGARNNLVENGDLRALVDGKSAGWAFISARPDIFRTSVIELPDGSRALQAHAIDSTMSGYWTQNVKVNPKTDYLVRLQVRLDSGKGLVYVHNEDAGPKLDARAYVNVVQDHPLVPMFWKRAWIAGALPAFAAANSEAVRFLADANEWTPIELHFNSGPHVIVALSLGAYFAAGTYQFKDVSMTLDDARSAAK